MNGSVMKRGENSYRLQVYMGSDQNGREIRFTKTVHVSNKKEAEKELAKFYLECEGKRGVKMFNCTLGTFIDVWWKEYVAVYTKRSTWRGYSTALNAHICPFLGKEKLRSITTMQIQKWINSLVAENLSPKTIRNYFSVLNNIFVHAIKWEYIDKNPCEKVSLPHRKKVEANYYTDSEVKALIEALNKLSDDELVYKVAIYLGVFAGLRKGEILGINEEDVCAKENEIRIVRARMIGPEVGPYEDTPKTESSKRIVSVPPELMDMIKRLMQLQHLQKELLGSKWKNSKALLKGREGGPLYPQNLQRWFSRFLKKNGLRHIGLHGLRHTHTSLLISMTDDISQISRRLGHSEISTTLNIYTHLFEDHDKQLAEDISKKFFAEEGKVEND